MVAYTVKKGWIFIFFYKYAKEEKSLILVGNKLRVSEDYFDSLKLSEFKEIILIIFYEMCSW